MSIVLTHMLGETDDGVLDPKEHRKLQKECPGMKLPGVGVATFIEILPNV